MPGGSNTWRWFRRWERIHIMWAADDVTDVQATGRTAAKGSVHGEPVRHIPCRGLTPPSAVMTGGTPNIKSPPSYSASRTVSNLRRFPFLTVARFYITSNSVLLSLLITQLTVSCITTCCYPLIPCFGGICWLHLQGKWIIFRRILQYYKSWKWIHYMGRSVRTADNKH